MNLKNKSIDELKALSSEMRQKLITEINKHGGHMGSNLAIVELTVSLLSRFGYENCRYLFDTGYQAYTFKTLTDRPDFLDKLGDKDYSIFQEIHEGDPYSGGHTSVSAAWAAGYNRAKDGKTVIEIIGDGSLAASVGLGGMLNFANSDKKGLFILNDNKQGIGINQFNYLDWKKISEGMNFDFFEVEDGHDFDELNKAWDFFEKSNKNVFVKVNTLKGLGLKNIDLKQSMHYYSLPGTGPKEGFVPSLPTVLGDIIEKINSNPNTVIVTAGMTYVYGLQDLIKDHPDQLVDAGIAEEIAIIEAAALANVGKEVYFVVFSSFIQRIYDQVIHDIIRNDLKINIIVIGTDITEFGDSHHGIYDINMFNGFPNISIINPSTDGQLLEALSQSGPTNTKVIRINNSLKKDNTQNVKTWNKLVDKKSKKLVVSYGDVVWDIKDFIESNNLVFDLVEATIINPINKSEVEKLLAQYDEVLFYERTFWKNNLHSTIINELDLKNKKIVSYSFKQSVIGRGPLPKLLKNNHMDFESILK